MIIKKYLNRNDEKYQGLQKTILIINQKYYLIIDKYNLSRFI